MKRSIFLALAACVALAACTKNEVKPVGVDQEITFQAVVNKASTKAMIDGTVYKTDAPSFGTAAYYVASGSTFPTGVKLYIPESEVKYNPTTYGWTTITPYYWPKNGALTFFSYSPYTINTSVTIDETNGILISNYDVDAHQTEDVLVADVVTETSNNTAYVGEGSGPYQNGVSTVFRHKLAQIVDVTFKTDKNYKLTPVAAGHKEFFINQVSIKSYKQTATYTSGNNVSSTHLGSWDTASVPIPEYVFFEEASSCDTEFGSSATSAKSISNGYLLVLPQTFANTGDAEFEIKYTIRTYSSASAYSDDVVTVNIPLYDILTSDHQIKMNKKYTFNFTVGLDQIYWAPSVENWDSEPVNYSPTI